MTDDRVLDSKAVEAHGLEKTCCPLCEHYDKCQKPCPPVEAYLEAGNPSTWREKPEAFLIPAHTEADLARRMSEDIFSTPKESPWRQYNPNLRQTSLFIDRFFKHWSFEDLAVKYDLTPAMARHLFNQAQSRIIEILNALDRRDSRTEEEKRSKRREWEAEYRKKNKERIRENERRYRERLRQAREEEAENSTG